MTGFVDMSSELVPKKLGLLHELVPRSARFGVLVSRTYIDVDRVTKDAQSAAAAMGRQLDILFAGTDREIDAAFSDLAQKRVDAFLVSNDAVLAGRRTQILTLAARHALPAIYGSRAWADAGGLMSYGPLLMTRVAKPASTPAASSRARSRPTCRWRRRPGSNSSSTSQPPGRSASTCRRRCSPAPTR